MIVSKLKRDENPTTYYAHCIWPFFGGRQEQRIPPIMGGEPDETLTLVPAAGRRTGNLAVPPAGRPPATCAAPYAGAQAPRPTAGRQRRLRACSGLRL